MNSCDTSRVQKPQPRSKDELQIIRENSSMIFSEQCFLAQSNYKFQSVLNTELSPLVFLTFYTVVSKDNTPARTHAQTLVHTLGFVSHSGPQLQRPPPALPNTNTTL